MARLVPTENVSLTILLNALIITLKVVMTTISIGTILAATDKTYTKTAAPIIIPATTAAREIGFSDKRLKEAVLSGLATKALLLSGKIIKIAGLPGRLAKMEAV